MTYVYLDTETTGLDPDKHGVIQVAFVIDRDTYKEWKVTPFGAEFDYEASLVNDIYPRSILMDLGFTKNHPIIVDFEMTEWLRSHGEPGKFTPVGWNVGSFDMQFLRKGFPNTYKMFGYRNLDLTALRIFATEYYDLDREEMKRTAAEQVSDHHGWGENFHDALYDAMVSYFEHSYLTEMICSQGDIR